MKSIRYVIIFLILSISSSVLSQSTDPALWNGTWKVTSTDNTDQNAIPRLNDTYTISNASYNDTVVVADVTWFAVGTGIFNGSITYNPTGPTLQIEFYNRYDIYSGNVSIDATTLYFTDNYYGTEYSFTFTEIPVVTEADPALWNGTWKVTSTDNTDQNAIPRLNDTYTISNASYNDTVVVADVTWFAVGTGIFNGSITYNPTGPTLQIEFYNRYDIYSGNVSIDATTLYFTDNYYGTEYSFTFTNLTTNIIDDFSENMIPKQFSLKQNFPNPFNPTTTIQIQIPISSYVTLRIYNSAGSLVKSLISDNLSSGNYKYIWNGKNEIGMQVSSGIYLYQLKAGSFSDIKRMIFIK
ncbi:FlgD immunoglobulin-like domain containing protein [candidate division KSB1 bacterium]